MKCIVKLRINTPMKEIDLEDYSYENKKWVDLTEEQQYEIQDAIREQEIISVTIEDI